MEFPCDHRNRPRLARDSSSRRHPVLERVGGVHPTSLSHFGQLLVHGVPVDLFSFGFVGKHWVIGRVGADRHHLLVAGKRSKTKSSGRGPGEPEQSMPPKKHSKRRNPSRYFVIFLPNRGGWITASTDTLRASIQGTAPLPVASESKACPGWARGFPRCCPCPCRLRRPSSPMVTWAIQAARRSRTGPCGTCMVLSHVVVVVVGVVVFTFKTIPVSSLSSTSLCLNINLCTHRSPIHMYHNFLLKPKSPCHFGCFRRAGVRPFFCSREWQVVGVGLAS